LVLPRTERCDADNALSIVRPRERTVARRTRPKHGNITSDDVRKAGEEIVLGRVTECKDVCGFLERQRERHAFDTAGAAVVRVRKEGDQIVHHDGSLHAPGCQRWNNKAREAAVEGIGRASQPEQNAQVPYYSTATNAHLCDAGGAEFWREGVFCDECHRDTTSEKFAQEPIHPLSFAGPPGGASFTAIEGKTHARSVALSFQV
jgi:hypothetical protein